MDKLTRKLLNNLEDLLVKEFRVTQALYNLEREEQAILLARDLPELAKLVKNRETVLIERNNLARAQHHIVSELISQMGLSIPEAHPSQVTSEGGYTLSSLEQFFAVSDPEVIRRFERLREGISILLGKAADLSCSNRTLAIETLVVDGQLQAGLIDRYLVSHGYLDRPLPPLDEPALEESIH